MASKCTLEDLKESELELLVPQMVAETLIQTARNAPDSLGFPVIKIGKRVRFPRRAFVDFMSGNLQDKSR